MPFITNPRRDASPTLAGFVFQVNLTILRWLALQEGEHLELECGEDIDTVQKGTVDGTAAEIRLLEQIKARTGRSLTLKSSEAMQALSNFCGHRAANPKSNLKFRYITTANSGTEQGWARPRSGVETWMALRRGEYDDAAQRETIAALRALLKSCERPAKVSADAWDALQRVLAFEDDIYLTEVIFAFEWGVGYGDYAESESEIQLALIRDGHATTRDDSAKVYEHLFAFVFRLLCQPGEKLLTLSKLAGELHAPSVTQADRGILQLVRNELDQMALRIGAVETAMARQVTDITALKQTVELIGKSFGFDSAFALGAASLSTELPGLVNPCAERDPLVHSLISRAQAVGTMTLVAEPGSGKTQLLVLVLRKIRRGSCWLNIPRGATEAQACILLDALIRSSSGYLHDLSFRESCDAAAEQLKGTVVIIDDLPRVVPGGPLSNRIETLARCLKGVGAYLLISSYFRLPATTEDALGRAHCDVPRFTSIDVAELLAAHDAPQSLRNENTYQLLLTVTEGLPILVAAALRFLANRSWSFAASELESLLRGEFAFAYRRDAAGLLQITVPDEGERELLIRLSLAIGTFSMEDIATVARVPQVIFLPGEKVQRATGLWLQQVGNGRYLRSPLITSSLADSLDPITRKGVHYVLARRILARKSLDPIEVFTCVSHLVMSGEPTLAVIVTIQILAAFVEIEGPAEDLFGFARMWSDETLSDVDLNLQLYLRALQIIVLTKQGRDALPMVARLDALLATPGAGWGAAVATGTLAVHLVWRLPTLANKYLLQALGHYVAARMPDGSPLPTGNYPLEILLWMSGYNCKSDEEVDSWLSTISQFTPAQMETLKKSELMEDNSTIFCDGIWRQVYLKPERERQWAPVKKKLEEVETTARAIGFELLEASAIRARLTVLAEWEQDLDAALAVGRSSLQAIKNPGGRFLITEVIGRQLSYANRRQEALTWLEQAVTYDAYHHSLWRRNVLITLAELYSPQDPRKAASFTAEAVRISQDGKLMDSIYIEALAEHGIALWNAAEEPQSLQKFEEATNILLAIRTDTDGWKGQFARFFGVVAYFSGVARNRKPDDGHAEPKQGLFLASNDQAHTAYRPEQLAFICIRLAMFAEGIKDISKAATWTWKAIEFAKQIPSASTPVHFQSYYAMPATLLTDDFVQAARLAALMMQVNGDQIGAPLNASPHAQAQAGLSAFETMVSSAPRNGRRSALLLTPLVPIALRLAFLRFRGATTVAIAAFLADMESVISPDLRKEDFLAGMRRALIEESDWRLLQEEADIAMKANQHARGFILSVGAIDKSPVNQSLYLQTWIAPQLEQLFARSHQSMYREIVAPFFRSYWERTLEQSVGLFRTAFAYTEQQMHLADGSSEGTRKLLSAMRFCLGATLPESAMKWLDESK